MSRTADLAEAIADNIEYAQKDVKAGKDPSAHLAKAAAQATELAGLAPEPVTAAPAAAVVVDPNLVPSRLHGGKLVSIAADLDASSIADANAGNPASPLGAGYEGQAAKESYTGVIAATSPGGSYVFTVFKDGAVVHVSAVGELGPDGAAGLAEQFGITQ